MDNEQFAAGLRRLAGRDPALSRKKESTRRRIIESASALFRELGVRRTTMEDIAERAGVSRATLYVYATSKEDIVIKALAEEQLVRLGDSTLLRHIDAPPKERLKILLADHIAAFERTPLLALFIKGDPELVYSLERHPAVRDAIPVDDDLLVSMIIAAFPATPIDEARNVALVIRTVLTVGPDLVENAPNYGSTPNELAARLASLLVEGIGGT